jgi:hypothetical protein
MPGATRHLKDDRKELSVRMPARILANDFVATTRLIDTSRK